MVPAARKPAGDDAGSTTAAGIRAMLIGWMGETVVNSMDVTDLMMTVLALENDEAAMPSRWRNPVSGNLYRVVSKRSYDEKGHPCLEYVMEALFGGRREEVHGTTCRAADGR